MFVYFVQPQKKAPTNVSVRAPVGVEEKSLEGVECQRPRFLKVLPVVVDVVGLYVCW